MSVSITDRQCRPETASHAFCSPNTKRELELACTASWHSSASSPSWCCLRDTALAQDASPKAPVDALSQKLLDVMRRGNELGYEARERELRPVVEASFDMPFMAGAALGPDLVEADAGTEEPAGAGVHGLLGGPVRLVLLRLHGRAVPGRRRGQADERRRGGEEQDRPALRQPDQADSHLSASRAGSGRSSTSTLDGWVSQLAIRRWSWPPSTSGAGWTAWLRR